jgi:hypothetical protein
MSLITIQRAHRTRRTPFVAGVHAVLVAAALLVSVTACDSPVGAHVVALHDVDMVSSGEGWAVGDGAIYHFTGGKWSAVAQPTNVVGFHLAMVSADEGWAVGRQLPPNNAPTLILHESGGQWTTHDTMPSAALPAAGSLVGLAVTAADEGWAVGGGANGVLVLRLQGGSWSPDPLAGDTLAQGNLEAVAALPDATAWAVGDGGLIMRRDATQWTQVTSPVTQDLHAIAMISAAEGWAVGGSGNVTEKGIILHYVGGAWTPISSIPTPGLFSLSMVSATEAWAGSIDGSFLHLQNGIWTKVASPTDHPIDGISMLSSSEGWAVCNGTSESDSGVFLHYANGAWSQYAA